MTISASCVLECRDASRTLLTKPQGFLLIDLIMQQMDIPSPITHGMTMTDFLYDAISDSLQRSYIAAFRILGNAEESRDACQEAAARALSARHKYDPAQPFYPWFYRILKNHCLDRLRQRKKTPSAQEEIADVISSEPSAESSLAAHEQQTAINRAIAKLPEEMREILELRHFQDLSYEEVADILGCPVGTVMSRLYRARQALRKVLLHDPTFRFDGLG